MVDTFSCQLFSFIAVNCPFLYYRAKPKGEKTVTILALVGALLMFSGISDIIDAVLLTGKKGEGGR